MSANDMYDLSSKFTNAFDVVRYVVSAMNESGFASDVDEYLTEAISSHNAHLIDISKAVLDKCNNTNVENFEDECYEGFTNNVNCDNSTDNDDEFYEGFSCRRY